MKITKEMGRACIRELETGVCERLATAALNELTGDEDALWHFPEAYTALAMCAAIAGVRPE